MADKKIIIELNKQQLSKYCYAVNSARELVDAHEFPTTAQDLEELENILSKAGKS